MGHYHVAKRARGFVERSARGEPQGFGYVDLDVIDEVSVPDRFEEAVGEAEGEDVLRRLFAEEVIDAEDLFLSEDLVEPTVERHCAGKVGAEGLFHHDPRALDELRVAEHLHRRERRVGRDAQVVESMAVGAELGLGLQHGGAQALGTRRERKIAEPLGEGLPGLVRHAASLVLLERSARDGAELVDVDLVERHADDAVVRDEARAH